MKNHIIISKQIITIPASSAAAAAFLFHGSIGRLSNESSKVSEGNKDISRRTDTKIKLRLFNVENFTKGFLEHVRLQPELTETVKGKLRLDARIVQVGGVEKVFKKFFCVENGEKLLKISQCYLSTTTGPIAGLIFITTEKVAFCSKRSIKFVSLTGKLKILLRKINRAKCNRKCKKTIPEVHTSGDR